MLRPEKVYVTPDDFKNVYGIDLRNALRSDDNESNQAERFIAMVTNHLKNWVNNNSFRRLDYDCLSPYQYEQWQRAILAQVYYTYKEGARALGLASGIDDERGVVISMDSITNTTVCEAAIDYLSNAGLFNLVMKNRPRTIRGYAGSFYDGVDGGPSWGGECPHPCPEPGPEPHPQPQPCPRVISGIGYTEED